MFQLSEIKTSCCWSEHKLRIVHNYAVIMKLDTRSKTDRSA